MYGKPAPRRAGRRRAKALSWPGPSPALSHKAAGPRIVPRTSRKETGELVRGCPSVFDPNLPMSKHTYYQGWRRILERAGLPPIGTHGIRHRSATDIANSGVPVKVGMALTAHKTLTVFMKYVHTEDDPVRAAAEAVNQRRQALLGGQPPSPPVTPTPAPVVDAPQWRPKSRLSSRFRRRPANPSATRTTNIPPAPSSETIGPSVIVQGKTAPSLPAQSATRRRRAMRKDANPQHR